MEATSNCYSFKSKSISIQVVFCVFEIKGIDMKNLTVLTAVILLLLSGCYDAKKDGEEQNSSNNQGQGRGDASGQSGPSWDGENVPFPRIAIKDAPKIQMTLITDSGLEGFTLKNYSSEFQDSYIKYLPKIDALKAIAAYYRSNDSEALNRTISQEPSYLIQSVDQLDRVLNLKNLSRFDYKKIKDKSGHLEAEGTISFGGEFYKVSGIKYSLALVSTLSSSPTLSQIDILKSSQIPITIEQTQSLHPFDFAQANADARVIYNRFLQENGSVIFKLLDWQYELKKGSEKRTYQEQISAVRNSTAQIQIFNEGEIYHRYIELGSPRTLESILKEIAGEDFEVETNDQFITKFMNKSSELPVTANWNLLKDAYQGRWFVISSRVNNTPKSMVRAGDSITIIFAQGEEIAEQAKNIRSYSFPSFSGKSRTSSLPPLKQGDHVKMIVSGIRKTGTKPSKQNAASRGLYGNCSGSHYGSLHQTINESIIVAGDNSTTHMGVFRVSMGDDFLLPSDAGFFRESEIESLNTAIYAKDFDDDLLKNELINVRFNTGSFSGDFHKRIYGNTCRGDYASGHAHYSDFGRKEFTQEYIYDVDFVIESYE